MSFLRFMATEARKYQKAVGTIVDEGRKWFGEHEKFKELDEWGKKLGKVGDFADKVATEVERHGSGVPEREDGEHEVPEVSNRPPGDRTVEKDRRGDASPNMQRKP